MTKYALTKVVALSLAIFILKKQIVTSNSVSKSIKSCMDCFSSEKQCNQHKRGCEDLIVILCDSDDVSGNNY